MTRRFFIKCNKKKLFTPAKNTILRIQSSFLSRRVQKLLKNYKLWWFYTNKIVLNFKASPENFTFFLTIHTALFRKKILTVYNIRAITLIIYNWSSFGGTHFFGLHRNFFGISRCISGHGRRCLGISRRIVEFVRIFSPGFLNSITWVAVRILRGLFFIVFFVFLARYILWRFKCVFTWYFCGTCALFDYLTYSVFTRWRFDFFIRISWTGFLGLEKNK